MTMPVTVRIPTPLRQVTKGNAEVSAKGATVDDLVADLERQFPGLKERLVKDFDIIINIRRADVKEDYGWVALEMEAGEDTLARGVRWLKDKGVQVDPIERDVIA